MSREKGTVVLIAFYNVKALGVRYLEGALTRAGFRVVTIFYKSFNSVHPQPTTAQELRLLLEKVRSEHPVMIGLSVMSSMYLETVERVIKTLSVLDAALVCGGAFASMCPEQLLSRGAAYVVRADGETPLPLLAEALLLRKNLREVPSLCWLERGVLCETPVSGIASDLERYGQPVVDSPNACLIEHNRLIPGDPQLSTRSYEVIASRGCPFTCSYCCCVNLSRLLPPGTAVVRTRSVQSVIAELKEAKRVCKKLAFIHFYDEIFPALPGWVDDFCEAYQAEIDLPFTVWSHPSMVRGEVLQKLVKVGLTEVIMGIQSGAPLIRREVFHRKESQQDIIEATRLIAQSGVFWASYDFMVQHPFETTEDLKQSYLLAKQLHGRFELQLHGLNFLPGTDIVPMAVQQGLVTAAQMEDILYAPMQTQFGAYWQRAGDAENMLWYNMLFCLQFQGMRRKLSQFEAAPLQHADEISALHRRARFLFRLRYYYKKIRVVLKSKHRKKVSKPVSIT